MDWSNDTESISAKQANLGRAKRFRAVGRDLGQFVFYLVTLGIMAFALLELTRLLDSGAITFQVGSETGDVLSGIVAVIGLGLYVGTVRLFERRFAGEAGASWRGARFGIGGLFLGIVLFALVMATLLVTGNLTVASGGTFVGLVLALFAALFTAVNEELLFRGMMFRLVERHVGTVPALLVTSALFGLAHAANPGATWVSWIAIALEAGILLGVAYVTARSLWFPIGLHCGWNFAETGVFGANLSGVQADGLLQSKFLGSVWLTGGAFGPEAGIPAIAICLAASLTLLMTASRQRTEGA